MINSKDSGFTLIELIMVIVLLGILSSSAVPKLFDKDIYSERVFFADVLNALRFAQKLAVASGCSVQFSVSSNAYTLKRKGSSGSTSCPGGTTYNLDIPHPSAGGSSYTGSESDVSLSSSVSSFTFTPSGSASNDVTLTVNGSKTINVIAATGFVYDSSS